MTAYNNKKWIASTRRVERLAASIQIVQEFALKSEVKGVTYDPFDEAQLKRLRDLCVVTHYRRIRLNLELQK